MAALTLERLIDIEQQLLHIQCELQAVVHVDLSIQQTFNRSQTHIIESIAEARSELLVNIFKLMQVS